MAQYVVKDTSLTAIADAIRDKTGKTAGLTLAEMPTEIESIEGGGSSGDTSELEEQIADLTAENTELKAQNDDLKEENESLSARTNELTMIKVNLESENATLTTEVENLTAENEELQARIEELESESGGDTAGAYTADGTFSNRVYTWVEMMQNGMYYEQYPPEDWGSGEDRLLSAYNYDVVVPDAVVRVGWFYCKNIVLPETTIVVHGTDAYDIEKVYIKATTPPTLESPAFYEKVFSGDLEEGEKFIIVPVGCGNVYKTATNWSEYADYIEEGEMPI